MFMNGGIFKMGEIDFIDVEDLLKPVEEKKIRPLKTKTLGVQERFFESDEYEREDEEE